MEIYLIRFYYLIYHYCLLEVCSKPLSFLHKQVFFYNITKIYYCNVPTDGLSLFTNWDCSYFIVFDFFTILTPSFIHVVTNSCSSFSIKSKFETAWIWVYTLFVSTSKTSVIIIWYQFFHQLYNTRDIPPVTDIHHLTVTTSFCVT